MDKVTPIVFLDIDGVLNALGGETDWGDTFDVWEGPPPHEFRLSLSKSMAAEVKSLGDVVWCTTWCRHAWRVGQHIDIKAEYLPLNHYGWKRAAVEKHLSHDPRPFVWLEDEPGKRGTMNGHPWPKHLPTGFIVNPNPVTGITREHIEQAREWLDA